jgi:hypothetical protein
MPSWKKVITSGSDAAFRSVIATAGFTGSFSGSLFGTASFADYATAAGTADTATNAGNALTADYATAAGLADVATNADKATNATDAVNAQTASFLPIGTYNITSSWATNALTASSALTASFITASSISGIIPVVNGGTGVTVSSGANSVVLRDANQGITASLFGTASWATNALTASFLPLGTYQITSSWAQSASQALTASFVRTAQTASYVDAGSITTGTLNNSRLPSTINVTNITASSFTGSFTGSLLGTASWAQSSLTSSPPTFLNYTSVPQTSSIITLQTFGGSDPLSVGACFDITANGLYYYEFTPNYTSALTATGAFFSVSGSVGNNYFSCTVVCSTANTDRAVTTFGLYDGGSSASSTIAATPTVVTATLTGHINVTSPGILILRFATETAGSIITVTGVKGFIRKLS